MYLLRKIVYNYVKHTIRRSHRIFSLLNIINSRVLRPEARIRKVRDNGGTKEFRHSVKCLRAGRTKSGNGEEEGKRQDGRTARRPKNKVARALATSGSFKKYVI